MSGPRCFTSLRGIPGVPRHASYSSLTFCLCTKHRLCAVSRFSLCLQWHSDETLYRGRTMGWPARSASAVVLLLGPRPTGKRIENQLWPHARATAHIGARSGISTVYEQFAED